ncbi:MAG: LPS export ABC transporter permease LptG [Pseudomonadales bacterium]|nr:LPS export ABC transporter permease LptG [Pseudomonadales bacterium]
MKILDRYIRRSVLGAFFIVLMIIVGLDLLSAFLAELEELERGYQTGEALRYVLMSFPRRVAEFIPVASLIGCLVGLGALANNSELIVMRAAGVSVGRIVFSVLKPTILILLMGGVLSEKVVPYTEQIAESERSLLKGGQDALKSGHGLWHREKDEIVHINAVTPDGRLYGISRYQFDDKGNMLKASFSEKGVYEKSSWVLTNTQTTEIFSDHTKVITQEQEQWLFSLTPRTLSSAAVDPEYLDLLSLYRYSRYLDEQELNSSHYSLAFWKKILQPLVTVAMVLIAVSFIFGPLRSVSMSFRVLVGVVVGLVFQQAQDFFGYASLVYNVDPLAAILIPVSVCLAAGLYMMSRVR